MSLVTVRKEEGDARVQESTAKTRRVCHDGLYTRQLEP